MTTNLKAPEVHSETIKCIEHLMDANPKIASIAVVTITRPAPLQERLEFNSTEKKHFQETLETRSKTGLPFWDCLLLESFGRVTVSDRLLNEVKFHQSNHGKEIWIARQDALDGALRTLKLNHEGDRMLSVLSEVRLIDGTSKQFIFLDFHIPVSSENTLIVEKVTRRLLSYPAFIIESGASYHVIGTKLVNDEEFRKTLTTALLFGPITDRAYITHQLLEGRAALRVSKGGHCNSLPTLLMMTYLGA